MIPPLPLELVSHILDLATSPSYAVSSRIQDRHLLRQCCLVTKQLYPVAQPKLRSVFKVKKDRNLASLAQFPQQAQHIRVLEYGVAHKAADLVNAIGKLPNLIDLRIRIPGSLPQVDLNAFDFLVHLTLYCVELTSSSAVAFPNLVSLTLNSVYLSPEAQDTLFLPASFSILRALHTQWCLNANTKNQIFLEPINLPPGQLDILQVAIADHTVSPADLHSRGGVTVLSFVLSHAYWVTRQGSFSDFQHLCVEATFSDLPHIATHLSDLVTLITTHETTSSLSLPELFSLRSPLSADVTAVRDHLLDICSRCNIDIIWRPYLKTAEDTVVVSKDYWDYAKELKRKKGIQGAGANE